MSYAGVKLERIVAITRANQVLRHFYDVISIIAGGGYCYEHACNVLSLILTLVSSVHFWKTKIFTLQ